MSKNLFSRIARIEESAREPEPLKITIAFVQPGGRVTRRLALENGKRTELPVAAGEYCESARAASSPRVPS